MENEADNRHERARDESGDETDSADVADHALAPRYTPNVQVTMRVKISMYSQ